MLPYMAVVLSYDHVGPATAHDSVYHQLQRQLPGSVYAQLTDGGLPYRRKMAESATAFSNQMPYYLVKPLYTWSAYACYKSGVSLLGATVLPSALCYFLIGLLLLIWVRRYTPPVPGIAFASLVMVSKPLLEIAGSSTPDALSALLILAALLAVEEAQPRLMAAALLLAVCARIDNVIPAMVLGLLMLKGRKRWLLPAVAAVSCLCITVAIPHRYGWSALYYPDFARSLNLDYTQQDHFRFGSYRDLVASHVMTGLFSTDAVLFAALGVLLYMGKRDRRLIGAIAVTVAVRFVLQPVIADRLYVPYYLCLLVLLARWVIAISIPVRCSAGPHPPSAGSDQFPPG